MPPKKQGGFPEPLKGLTEVLCALSDSEVGQYGQRVCTGVACEHSNSCVSFVGQRAMQCACTNRQWEGGRTAACQAIIVPAPESW
jgi:hypothetical protein